MDEEDWDSVNSKFLTAVGNNNIALVKQCLTENADINAKDHLERSPLHIAVENRFGEIVRLLLMNRADVNSENSSKSAPAEVARSLGYDDLYNLLYMMETTQWSPGLDPDLLLTQHSTDFLDSKLKSTLIIELSQIEAQLAMDNMESHFDKYEKNNIDWLQYIRLDDDCLQKIGIMESDDRKIILQGIQKASERKWQDISVIPYCMQKDFTSYEATCVLTNLHVHTGVITSRVNALKMRIMERPEMLRHNMEIVPIENLGAAIGRANELVDKFTQSLHDLSDELVGNNKTGKKNEETHGFGILTSVGILLTLSAIVGTGIYIRLRRRS